MTHAYYGLSRAFPCFELEAIKFSVDSSNKLVFRISCFRGLSHDDDDADADAAVGLLKAFSLTKTATRCRLVPIGVFIEGLGL